MVFVIDFISAFQLLLSVVKSTEYKKEKAELIEQPEPVTVKDSQPEKANKDAVQVGLIIPISPFIHK